MNKDEDAGATLTFETHTVSITPRERKQSTRMPIEMNEDSISNLLDPATSPDERYINQRAAEGHYRIISPFLALALVLVATTGVLYGQIRRSTWSKRAVVTVCGGVFCISFLVSARSLATEASAAVPLIYISMLVPIGVLIGMLSWKSLGLPVRPADQTIGALQ